MSIIGVVQKALTELGDVPAGEIASYVERVYGVKVDPRLVPIIKATLKDKEIMAQKRAMRAAALLIDQAATTPALP